MSDDVDRAQDRAETLRQDAIARTLRGEPSSARTGPCVDCREDIDPARVAALAGRGPMRCVSCQEEFEHLSRRR